MTSGPLFDRVTIIGLGLIGGSIARAVRTYGLAHTIAGCDQNDMALAYGRAHNVIDVAMRDAKMSVADSQLVILCAPPATFGDIAAAIAPKLQSGAILMDTASVKQAAIAAIAPHVPAHVEFIPAHPIAGSEQSGISAGRGDLFQRKHVIVTPQAAALTPGLQKITAFWKAMGARVDAMPPHLHDEVYAHVSHLPQLLSFAAHGLLEDYNHESDTTHTLRKFLRLSRSNPVLWAEIFIMNKDNVLKSLDRYLDVISHMAKELKSAPQPAESPNKKLAASVLFPRLAASCLVTTVMEAERVLGLSFARYAGTGFADFTSPASTPPEEYMENVSNHYPAVGEFLEDYSAKLKQLRGAIDNGNHEPLQEALVA